jgi:putative phage-type endonuclease
MLSAAQQAVRSRGIGGSEIAAVAGIDPYRSPLDIALRKKHLVEREPETHHQLRGQYVGPALAAWYEAKTGKLVTHRGAHEQTLQSEAHPIVIATPDGLVHSAGRGSKVIAVLEVKTPYWRTAHLWGAPGTDEIPEHYVPQAIWEMAAANVNHADVGALLDGDLPIYTVPFDADLFAALLEAAERFWRDYIETDNLPPADGSETARAWLLKQHPRATRDMLEGAAREAELLRSLRDATTSRKELEEREELLKQQLMEIIGDHEGLSCEAGRITWRCNKDSTRVDWEALAKSLAPTAEQIAQYTTTKPGARVFRPAFAK